MPRWFSIAAVDMIIKENYVNMVSLTKGEITAVPLEGIVNKLKLVDIKKYYNAERYNGRRSIL